MKATRIASTATPFSRSIGIGVACCGWELKTRGSIFLISGKNSSSDSCIALPTPVVSRPAGSRRSIRIPMAYLWVGLFPRALDRLDRKTGKITHYVPTPGDENGVR